jgi:hypothetical protein
MRTPETDLEKQIEAAFDYRGDVTLTLSDGETLVGYVFNRDFAPHPTLRSGPFIEVSLPNGEKRKLELGKIKAVDLTGKDHAATESG